MPNEIDQKTLSRVNWAGFPEADRKASIVMVNGKPNGNIMLPRCRLTFVDIFEPVGTKSKPDDKKFRVATLIPPNCDLSVLNQAIDNCAKEKHKSGGKLRHPALKAGEYPYAGYADGWTLFRLTANPRFPPGVVGPDRSIVRDSKEAYSGRWAVVTVSPFYYPPSEGSAGVSLGLRNVQLLDHDESLIGGMANPEDEFQATSIPAGGSAGSMFGGASASAAAPGGSMFG